MTVCGQSKTTCRGARGGFTLLEVLLTSILMATLLAGVWSLFHVYTRLFETGQARTEQAQLVRSLMRQMSDDLRSAIQDTASRPPQTPATAALRRFGMFGTSHSLHFDIMRVPPIEDRFFPGDDVAGSTVAPAERDDAAWPKAPEFRTIEYTFEEPEEASGVSAYEAPLPADEQQHPRYPGLTRRELDWEIPGGGAEPDGRDLRFLPPVSDMVGPGSGVAAGAGSSEENSLDDRPVGGSALMYVPEVVGLEFRYFDGRGWTNSWNSIQRKSLPAAVEISVEIEPVEREPAGRRVEDARASGVEFVAEQNPSGLNELTALSRAAIHRMVVYLPVSPLQRPPEKVGTVTQRIKAGVPNRAVEKLRTRRERLRDRTEAAPAPPADEHLRNPR